MLIIFASSNTQGIERKNKEIKTAQTFRMWISFGSFTDCMQRIIHEWSTKKVVLKVFSMPLIFKDLKRKFHCKEIFKLKLYSFCMFSIFKCTRGESYSLYIRKKMLPQMLSLCILFNCKMCVF